MSEDDTRDDEADEAKGDGEPGGSKETPSSAGGSDQPKGPDDAPGVVRALQALNNAVGRAELGVIAVVLVILVLVGSYAALYGIGGKNPGTWPKELVKYSVFFIAMIGAALAAGRQQLIAMDIVGRFAPPRVRAWIRAITNLFGAGISAALLMRGIDVSKVEMKSNVPYEIVSPGLGSWILPIGAGLIAFHLLLHTLIDLTYLVRGELAPESTEVKVH